LVPCCLTGLCTPISYMQKQAICYKCQGKCHLECRHCNGTGILGPAGYNKKTTLPKEILGDPLLALPGSTGCTDSAREHKRCGFSDWRTI
jgi:hypothetical protein